MPKQHVNIDNRHFIVKTSPEGAALMIYERVVRQVGRPFEHNADLPRWHHSAHDVPKKKSALYYRVLDAAGCLKY